MDFNCPNTKYQLCAPKHTTQNKEFAGNMKLRSKKIFNEAKSVAGKIQADPVCRWPPGLHDGLDG